MQLNARAADLCRELVADPPRYRIAFEQRPCGARVVDCGIHVSGGLETGRLLAEISMAGLGRVGFVPSAAEFATGPAVLVSTDHPVAACMAAQYAGWQVSAKKYFAMGSGPMRAAAGKESLFQKIGFLERPDEAVGVLESRQLPSDEICQDLARACGVDPSRLTLLVAPTASLAGAVQVVARSVETALHKLFELEFDLARITSAVGIAPLPPASGDDLVAIGRTNDAILYGGEVTLWVVGDDASLEAVGPRVPSSASRDSGRPFAAIFAAYERDFYKIDPHLFSPAVVTLANLETGHSFRYGQTVPRVVHESFAIRRSAASAPTRP